VVSYGFLSLFALAKLMYPHSTLEKQLKVCRVVQFSTLSLKCKLQNLRCFGFVKLG
jgi:hypothetical protein